MGVLTGKVGLIVGVANKRSIAWAIAQAADAEGAKLILTYQGERLEENVRELAATLTRAQLSARLFLVPFGGVQQRVVLSVPPPLRVVIVDDVLFTGRTVRAALDAQTTLANAQWPTSTPIRVRMGLHTGETAERDGDYFGPAVNRAARIMAAPPDAWTVR